MSTAAPQSAAARGPRVELRLTKAGLVAVLLALVMLAAALNTGNNLLYLLAALVLSTLPVSVHLASRSLRAVSAELLLPSEVRAGDEAAAALRLRSEGREGVGLRVSLVDAEAVGLPFVEAGGATHRPLPLHASRRGPLRVETRIDCLYPWGLMRARREGPVGELLVLPRPVPGAVPPVLMGSVPDGKPTRLPGPGQDLLEIRNYLPGDDARLIDWKATARRERVMLRQGAREEDRRATVVIDPSPSGTDEGATERVEQAISRAAGAVISLMRKGWQVRLVHPGGESRGSELEQLRVLARLEIPSHAFEPGWWRSRVAPGEPVIACRSEALPR